MSVSNTLTEKSAATGDLSSRQFLLVGDDFAWLPANARLAGRAVQRCADIEEALVRLSNDPIDGLIACLPSLEKNLALLDAAAAAHPGLACGVRAEAAQVAKTALAYPVIPAAQSLEVLDDLTRTMFASSQWNANPSFAALKARIARIPALPDLYAQITAALQKENTSLEDLAKLVAREPAITTKLLQVVNSPLFALRQRVTSVRDAAGFLGMQRIRALVLSTSLIGKCDASRCPSFAAEEFEKHGLQIANWAAQIVIGETRNRALSEQAFTAGLLHQFGILLLAANLPESYGKVLHAAKEQNVTIASIERESYGVTHAELAGFVLAAWNLPYPIVKAVGFYPSPSLAPDQEFSPLTAVHLATAIDSFVSTGVEAYDYEHLKRLNLLPKLDHWSRTLADRPWPLAA